MKIVLKFFSLFSIGFLSFSFVVACTPKEENTGNVSNGTVILNSTVDAYFTDITGPYKNILAAKEEIYAIDLENFVVSTISVTLITELEANLNLYLKANSGYIFENKSSKDIKVISIEIAETTEEEYIQNDLNRIKRELNDEFIETGVEWFKEKNYAYEKQHENVLNILNEEIEKSTVLKGKVTLTQNIEEFVINVTANDYENVSVDFEYNFNIYPLLKELDTELNIAGLNSEDAWIQFSFNLTAYLNIPNVKQDLTAYEEAGIIIYYYKEEDLLIRITGLGHLKGEYEYTHLPK